MEVILAQLDRVAEQVKGLEKNRRMLGEFIRDIKSTHLDSDDVLEKTIALPVVPDSLDNKKIMGVDGGIVRQSYHAVDLILTRSVGVTFSYRGGTLAGVDYYPSAFPSPRLTVISDTQSIQDFSLSSSLERLRTEVDTLIGMSKLGGDLLLADGSIVPHPLDKPKSSSSLSRKYESIVESYKDLFSSKVLLAGVIEDSRSKRVSDILGESIMTKISDERVPQLTQILKSTRDTNLLYHVLKEGERSCVFRYGEDAPVLKDFGDHARNIYSFYLRTTGFDRPLRIDFYAEKDPTRVADLISSMLLPISSHNEEYGYPSVLVESDSKAKLREDELDVIHSYIVDKVGIVSSLYKLRRNSRPF